MHNKNKIIYVDMEILKNKKLCKKTHEAHEQNGKHLIFWVIKSIHTIERIYLLI